VSSLAETGIKVEIKTSATLSLLDIMDRLKAAGVEKVGIVSKLPGEQ